MTHPNLTHWDAVAADEDDVGELRGRRRDLGSAAGSFRAGVSLAGKVFLCGAGVIGRLEPVDYGDGEE